MTTDDLYAELRTWDPVRLRVFEWLRQTRDLGHGLPGKIVGEVSPSGSVKMAWHPAPREVQIGEN